LAAGAPVYGDHVTIRQLLNHTGGVPDYAAIVSVTMDGFGQGRFRAWAPQELVALVADQPPSFPPGTSWSYSNTGYVLLGLTVEAATGNRLGQELHRRIFRPLGLRDSCFPVNALGIPSPMSCGYRLALSPRADVTGGQLVDVTLQNPSHAWAAGALVSGLQDLTCVLRALLSGRLLPPRRDPGFSTIVLSTPDGRQQLGIMVNVGERAPNPVSEAFLQGYRALGMRLLTLQGAPTRTAGWTLPWPTS
jgi:D-alanyl-D-alanine carboxypeptidase